MWLPALASDTFRRPGERRGPMPSDKPAPSSTLIEGVRIPALMYGTAWKEDRTEGLVGAALRAGFRGIDTANQRKHYHEAGVGAALRHAFAEGVVSRDDLFVQTKFTFVRGQDHRLPYDPSAPFATQVAQSCASSLDHLGVDSLDAYLLHGPSTHTGLADADRETWRGMEAQHDAGHTRLLGVSNIAIDQLAELHAFARVKPTIVQNRSFTRPAADLAVRQFCADHGMAYEGFSLLTAIPMVLDHSTVLAIAAAHERTPAEIVLRFCLNQGMTALTGTTSENHMAQDLSVATLRLSADEMHALGHLLGNGPRAKS